MNGSCFIFKYLNVMDFSMGILEKLPANEWCRSWKLFLLYNLVKRGGGGVSQAHVLVSWIQRPVMQNLKDCLLFGART